jgi:hypothetical protein
MCDDHPPGGGLGGVGSGVSRRNFLGGVTAAALLSQLPWAARLPLRSAARPVAANGMSAYSMAMHVHSSFSEYDGSMDAQLWQATQNAVDVLWWTEHDQRLNDLDYRKTVHFTSLTDEQPGKGQGPPWDWQSQHSGPVASSSGSIVQTPCSPNDPVVGGALSLAVTSSSTSPALYGFWAKALNYQANLAGQSLSIDVLLNPGWARGYLEFAMVTSYHEAYGGRPAGDYALSYRLVPAGGQGGRTAEGDLGVVTIPVDNSSGWVTVTVTPAEDVAALWPDLDYRDFGLSQLSLHAVSLGDAVSGYFDYLRFKRSLSGEVLLQQQHQIGARLATEYPSVIQQYGLEFSLNPGTADPHLNWFGSGVTVQDYGDKSTPQWLAYLASTVADLIHPAGGLASYNHPFGVNWPTNKSPNQKGLLASTAALLLPSGAYPGAPAALGCDLLEVGYPLRGGPSPGAVGAGGVDLAHHLALWDVMSRNAVFLTGNGTSDDHWGQNWREGMSNNNWATSVWASSTGLSDLLAALAAGRAWCGSLSQFGGPSATLDLVADGCCPMGSVSLSALTTRQLTVTATGIPTGGWLHVLQGAVDYAGHAGLASNAQKIHTFTAAQLASHGGSGTVTVDTTAESYIRTVVLDASGQTIIGASNPVWLLHNAPPGGIPAPRQTSC